MADFLNRLFHGPGTPAEQELRKRLQAMHRRAQKAEAQIHKAKWWLSAVRSDTSPILIKAFVREAFAVLKGDKT